MLKSIIDRIDQFSAQCEADEHTDTEQAWELLRAIRDQLSSDTPEADRFRRDAIDRYCCEDVDIDSDAKVVALDNGGAYVSAWVYVDPDAATPPGRFCS